MAVDIEFGIDLIMSDEENLKMIEFFKKRFPDNWFYTKYERGDIGKLKGLVIATRINYESDLGFRYVAALNDYDGDVFPPNIAYSERRENVSEKDITELAREIAEGTQIEFEINGYAEMCEEDRLNMEFSVIFSKGKLTVYYSDWWLMAETIYEDAEEANAALGTNLTEEEYDELCEVDDFYVMKNGENRIVATEIPLVNIKEYTL